MGLCAALACPRGQVVLTLLGVAAVATSVVGLSGPSAIILGGALAMSSTAVAIQVLEDRGEMGSRHGRATFSVLLLQVRPPPPPPTRRAAGGQQWRVLVVPHAVRAHHSSALLTCPWLACGAAGPPPS